MAFFSDDLNFGTTFIRKQVQAFTIRISQEALLHFLFTHLKIGAGKFAGKFRVKNKCTNFTISNL